MSEKRGVIWSALLLAAVVTALCLLSIYAINLEKQEKKAEFNMMLDFVQHGDIPACKMKYHQAAPNPSYAFILAYNRTTSKVSQVKVCKVCRLLYVEETKE